VLCWVKIHQFIDSNKEQEKRIKIGKRRRENKKSKEMKREQEGQRDEEII